MFIKIDADWVKNNYIDDYTNYKNKEEVIADATKFYHEHFQQEDDYDKDFEVKTFEQAKEFWECNGYEVKERKGREYICPVCDSKNTDSSGSEIEGGYITYHYYCKDCGATYDEDFELVFSGFDNVSLSSNT